MTQGPSQYVIQYSTSSMGAVIAFSQSCSLNGPSGSASEVVCTDSISGSIAVSPLFVKASQKVTHSSRRRAKVPQPQEPRLLQTWTTSTMLQFPSLPVPRSCHLRAPLARLHRHQKLELRQPLLARSTRSSSQLARPWSALFYRAFSVSETSQCVGSCGRWSRSSA